MSVEPGAWKLVSDEVAPGHPSLRQRVRPLIIGLSVSTSLGTTAGTLGYFVSTRGRKCFLSTAGALVGDSSRFGDLVFQPGALDAGSLKSSDRIGFVEFFTELSPKRKHQMDAALVVLLDKVAIRGNVLPSLECGAYPYEGQHLAQPMLPGSLIGKRVGKVGRSTGYTEANVSAESVEQVTVIDRGKELIFESMIEVTSDSDKEPFSKAGDGGAVIFTVPDLVPVGLLTISGYLSGPDNQPMERTYACPINKVLSWFEAEALEDDSSSASA